VGAEHLGDRLAEVVRVRFHAENPVALFVQQRHRPGARNRQDAVAHAGDNLPEEGVAWAAGWHQRHGRDGERGG